MIDEKEKEIFRQNVLPQYLDYISNIKKSKKVIKIKKLKYKQIERIKNEKTNWKPKQFSLNIETVQKIDELAK